MSRVMLDTNAYTALMAGDTRIADLLARSEAVLLSPVILGELYDGFLNGNRNLENRRILGRFLDKPRTLCPPITDTTAEWFAEIKRSLRRRGTPIPINDVWIAASCMEHGARLLTFDAHFAVVDGLLRCELR
ncbi:type II toxin-antitoxin system VapC family toxin [Spirochaeta africana]|uniref:Ribonuclease VapC n=1 Tax=Spirochaeta africana (strain ATCC 700263 / DSM 8902 / Z-7692) TaxID=889378 RepID=H9UG96_SPIAZ|nr:type II toxin-antitoxin system VapC family toxin [Spirochaeta africana]AFG36539.1 putative nucleic acid-binding protein, contains PIN domain [Spirochaeta africana DSM 8902]